MRKNHGPPVLALTTVVTAALLLGGLFVVKRMVGGDHNVAVQTAESIPARPVSYGSYREAMADLEVGAARALATTDEERALVDAFGAELNADTSAGRRLEALRTAKDPAVRRIALEILGQHLLVNGRWRAFVALADESPGLLEGGSLTAGDLAFARALATAPPERFVLTGGARVPTDRTLNGTPQIVARLNGRIRHLVLDTGASVTVLSSDLARACDIEPIGVEAGEGASAVGAAVTFRPAVITRLELGSFVIENHPAVIVDPEVLTLRVAGVPVMKLDGIIGWPVFRHVAARIDPERGWTSFTRTRYRERRPRNLFWLGRPAVTLRSESGRRLNFALETGAAHSGFKPRLRDKVPVGPTARDAGAGAGLEGDRLRDVLLHMDGHTLRFDPLPAAPGAEGAAVWRPDGRLGYDIAGRGVVVVDWPSGRFDLEP